MTPDELLHRAFWTCPRGHTDRGEDVRWDGEQATCGDCGATRLPELPSTPEGRLLPAEKQRLLQMSDPCTPGRRWDGPDCRATEDCE